MRNGHVILISTSTFGEFDETPIDLLHEQGLKVVANPHRRKLSENEVIDLGRNAIGIIAGTENLSARVLSQLKSLKVISRCGVGMDNVDREAANRQGIKTFATVKAEKVAQAVAELTLALILDVLRQISSSDRDIRQGRFEKRMGALLCGKKVGIVGYGEIGKKVGDLCSAFQADVRYYDLKDKRKGEAQRYGSLDELLKDSDIVSLHVPYNKETHHMIGAKQLKLMKPGSYLINCSRGGIVDEETLYQALKAKHLAGAALDVFEREPYNGPLKELDKAVLTPHIGSYAKEARIQMETEAVENLIKGLKGNISPFNF